MGDGARGQGATATLRVNLLSVALLDHLDNVAVATVGDGEARHLVELTAGCAKVVVVACKRGCRVGRASAGLEEPRKQRRRDGTDTQAH